MLKIAVAGLGKMGLSHHSIINAHPRVSLEAVCDPTGYILDVLHKYTGIRTFTDFATMLRDAELDAVIIATPSSLHSSMVRASLDRGLHVFCEKPFCLDARESDELAKMAAAKAVINQVGYHYRFVGAFQEVKRLLDAGAIGRVTHILAEAYGPVALRPKGSTWRSRRREGGGCLYDYAAHPLNLINWYLGAPSAAGGCVVSGVFSKDSDDEAYGTLYFDDAASAQLSVNWSDESHRKMTTTIRILGTAGRIYADRQECRAYLRDTAVLPPGYRHGWNVRYTTDLTSPVWFYVRGEEYSAQLDYFVRAIEEKRAMDNVNSFEQATMTDRVIEMMIADAENGSLRTTEPGALAEPVRKRRRLLSIGKSLGLGSKPPR